MADRLEFRINVLGVEHELHFRHLGEARKCFLTLRSSKGREQEHNQIYRDGSGERLQVLQGCCFPASIKFSGREKHDTDKLQPSYTPSINATSRVIVHGMPEEIHNPTSATRDGFCISLVLIFAIERFAFDKTVPTRYKLVVTRYLRYRKRIWEVLSAL